MAANQTIAQAYFDKYTVSELETIRDACLEIHAGSGRRSISFEGSSLTVDVGNCESVLETVMEAMRMHAAAARGDDTLLSMPGYGAGVSFINKRIT